MHFPRTSFYDFFVVYRENAIKVSALPGKNFRSYSDRQQEQKNQFCTVPIWKTITDYAVGTCVILFTMDWGIHQGIVVDLNISMLSNKKDVQA